MEELEIHVFELDDLKEGQIIEIIDPKIEKERAKRGAVMMKKLIKENPDIEDEKLVDLLRKEMRMLDVEVDNIFDDVKNRKWGKVIKAKDKKGKITVEIERLDKSDYHKYIDQLAGHISKSLSEKDIKNLVKDAIADKALHPEKLKELAEKKDEVKVEAKKGCFNIVLNKETIIPLR